jgi:hypothetical protein
LLLDRQDLRPCQILSRMIPQTQTAGLSTSNGQGIKQDGLRGGRATVNLGE